MSLLNKVMLALLIGLSILAAGEYLHIRYQSSKLANERSLNIALEDSLDKAYQTIKAQTKSAEVTDQVVTSTTQTVADNNQTKEDLTKKIDDVAKQVANEEISDTIADATYTRSMWAAYCKADPTSVTCTSRQPATKVSH